MGSAEIEHRHDLVVRADAPARTLLDRWSGYSRFARSPTEDSVSVVPEIGYADGILRVVTTTRERHHWFDWDWLTGTCEGDCEPPAAGDACILACRRDRYGDDNDETGLIREIKLIDAAGDATRPGLRTFSKLYRPLAPRLAPLPGEDAPTGLLIFDDGRTGWLLVLPREASDLFGEGEALPAPVPCRLYDRGAAATGTQAMRPDQRIPADCCRVATAPDGGYILVSGLGTADTPEAGVPLALVETATGRCRALQLAEDDAWGQAPYDRLGDPVFSPDGRRLGLRVQRGETRWVVVDGRDGPALYRVSAPVFSADGRQVAYWARDKGKESVVLDGRRGPSFDGAALPVFDPASGEIAYRVRDGRQWRVRRGGGDGPVFDDIGTFWVAPQGRVNAIADLVFSPGGDLAYAGRRGVHWHIVCNQTPGAAFDHVGLPVFSPDGRRLAHRARLGTREFIVLDGVPGPGFDFVGTPVFAPDGKTVAYWARRGDDELIVHGDRRGPVFRAPSHIGAPAFDAAGDGPYYLAEIDDLTERLMDWDRVAAESASMWRPTLAAATGELAYWGSDADGLVLSRGGRVGLAVDWPAYAPETPPLVYSPDGRHLAHAAGSNGRSRMRLDDRDGLTFDEVGEPVFSPAGDRLAYRARLGDVWVPVVRRIGDGEVESGATVRRGPGSIALVKVVPHLIPHPVAVGGMLLGGSADRLWVDNGDLERLGIPVEACASLGLDWFDPAWTWRLYSWNGNLGACTGAAVHACTSASSGATQVELKLPGCRVRDWSWPSPATGTPFRAPRSRSTITRP